MPTFRVTVHETRVYECESASEADARAIFEDDIAEPPIGSERSVTRTGVTIEQIDEPLPTPAVSEPRASDPSSEPTIPPPRVL